LLEQWGEVDVLISGSSSDVQMPFSIKYVLGGLSFVFGKKGGVDLLETYRKSRLKQFLKEVKQLPVDKYELVISDFEPVSAWACELRNKPCIALSHQVAVLNKNAPRPAKKDPVGRAILKSYAPANVGYGFHFMKYDNNIFSPVIRKAVRDCTRSNLGHYTVYLPAYSDKRILKVLSQCSGVRWEIFSKHFTHAISSENIRLYPVSGQRFLESMASSAGVLCGAGFETPAEALYLRKKLMVVPMKGQFEQQCNAAALSAMGVPVLKRLREKIIPDIQKWIESADVTDVAFPDETAIVLRQIIETHAGLTATGDQQIAQEDLTVKKLRSATLKKILLKLSH
jgi:uncharacterized protein (TIGR00661 family)